MGSPPASTTLCIFPSIGGRTRERPLFTALLALLKPLSMGCSTTHTGLRSAKRPMFSRFQSV